MSWKSLLPSPLYTPPAQSPHTIQGNIKLLLDDIAHLQPTVFPSVPRVLNKLHDRIMEGIGQKPAFVQWLIGKATESKLAEVWILVTYFA